MLKYAIVIDETTKKCDVALGTDAAYYESQGMTLQDVAQDWRGQWYLAGHAPEKPAAVKAQEEIAELKEKLAKTDYAVIKIAEGAGTSEEYADIIAQRAQWRIRINELEAELAE